MRDTASSTSVLADKRQRPEESFRLYPSVVAFSRGKDRGLPALIYGDDAVARVQRFDEADRFAVVVLVDKHRFHL
jgi:hypothetical protein